MPVFGRPAEGTIVVRACIFTSNFECNREPLQDFKLTASGRQAEGIVVARARLCQ